MKDVTRRGFFEFAGIAAAAIPLLGAVTAEAQQQQPVAANDPTVERDVVYGRAGDMDLHLDIYRPPAGVTPRRMGVLHLHGGGFAGGSKAGVEGSARAFVAVGYVSIGVQYRLSGQAKWPAQIEDVKAAIRWTRANASRLGIDADRIAVAGYSAGGFLALTAAGTADKKEFEGNGGNVGVSTKLAGCVAFFASTSGSAALFPPGTDQTTIAALNASNFISPTFAPTIFLHGLADVTIRPESSIDFFQKLRAQNVKVDLHLIQGAPHEFQRDSPDAALLSAQAANLFFDRLVINPKEYPPFGAGRGGGARGAGQSQ